MAKNKAIELKLNDRVKHSKYGLGTITEIWRSRLGTFNYAIKFDKGGPVGFAERANNSTKDLTLA